MTKKIKAPTKLTVEEEQEIQKLLSTIEVSTDEQIDSSIGLYGRYIIYAYRFWLITDSQRWVLTRYKNWRAKINNERKEKTLSEKMMILEQSYDEPPMIYQMWYIQWRIIVSSTQTVHIPKDNKTKEVANWWKNMILEIYKETTPKAYEYARERYQLFIR